MGELTYRQLLDPKAFMRELTVQWKVTPTGEDTCSVEHTMFVEPRVNIPAAFRGNMGALLTRRWRESWRTSTRAFGRVRRVPKGRPDYSKTHNCTRFAAPHRRNISRARVCFLTQK